MTATIKATKNSVRVCGVVSVLLISLFATGQGQTAASGTWALTASQTGSTIGSVTAADQALTGLQVTYQSSAQRCSPTGTAGAWPNESAENASRYMEFPLSPTTGHSLTVTGISMYLYANSGSGMRANVYYATDASFSSPTQIGGTYTLGNTIPGKPNVSASINLSVPSGSSVYVRVYPWYTSATTTKYIIANTVLISGTTDTSAVAPGLSVTPASLTFGAVTINTTSSVQSYSLAGSGLTPSSGSITVTVPTAFEVSLSSGSGFASSVQVSYTGAAAASTSVYVRFRPPAVQGYSGNVSNAGGGVATMTVGVSGSGVSAPAPAGDYVVSPAGSDSNPGTLALPFATIGKAVSSAQAGDTIYVRGGTFAGLTATISISKNGTTGIRYYLLAYPGERPVLDFSAMSVSSSNRGLSLSGSYWTIKGLDIRGAGDNGMNVSGSNNVIEFCSFLENRDSGLQLGGGASNNQIINCDSYFNADPGNGNADGFSPKLDVGSGNYFYGCRSWQNSDDGWDGYLRPANDVTTTLENCWCFMNGYLSDGTASAGNGNGFKMGGSDGKDLMHNFVLKRCIAFDNRVKGFDQNNNRGSMTLYNCTGYRNGTNYSIADTLAYSQGKVLTVKNSAALGPHGTLRANAVQQTNSWLSPFVVTTGDFVSIDTTGVRGPRKTDGSLPDVTFLHLASGSDLIDAGTDVGMTFNGSAPDLGAFESDAGLPVELVDFRVRQEEGGVVLRWHTASETDCAGFGIERRSVDQSSNGLTSWNEIGFVAGAGTSQAPREYSFRDNSNGAGRFAYRLRQVDRNGAVVYSSSIEVENTAAIVQPWLSECYPNPFNPTTVIRYQLSGFGDVKLAVVDLLGREAAVLVNESKPAGVYSVTWNGMQSPSGVYFVRLTAGGKTMTRRVVLLR